MPFTAFVHFFYIGGILSSGRWFLPLTKKNYQFYFISLEPLVPPPTTMPAILDCVLWFKRIDPMLYCTQGLPLFSREVENSIIRYRVSTGWSILHPPLLIHSCVCSSWSHTGLLSQLFILVRCHLPKVCYLKNHPQWYLSEIGLVVEYELHQIRLCLLVHIVLVQHTLSAYLFDP